MRKGWGNGFTLLELLVVITIVAILAAILFPVFGAVRSAAQKTACLSNAKQLGLSLVMYNADNDDTMVLADSGGSYPQVTGWGHGHPDHLWGELIQPYLKNWEIFRCPMDGNATDQTLGVDPITNQPLAATADNYQYALAERNDYGLNYDFLSPWKFDPATGQIGSQPVGLSLSTHPASTILTLDTVWNRDQKSGAPVGGGNWVAEAPCVYNANGQFMPAISETVWYNYGGWRPNPSGTAPFSWLEFGAAWPRHSGQLNITFLDGHARSVSIGNLARGCDVKSAFGGNVTDEESYLWGL